MVIKAWNRLLRLPNLFILAWSQFLVFRCLIYPFFEPDELTLNFNQFLLLILAFTMVCASGNVINAIYDRHLDAHEESHFIIPKYFSLQFCWMLYISLIGVGAAISFYLALTSNQTLLWWIYPLSVFLLWIYSYKLKCFPVMGNLIVAAFTGLALLFIPFAFRENLSQLRVLDYSLWAQLNYRFLMLGIFAMLCNLCRELIKDLEDFIPDQAQQCQSTAVYYGIPTAKKMTFWCMLALDAVLVLDMIRQPTIFNQVLAFVFALVPASYCSFKLYKSFQQNDFAHVSASLKFLMLSGLILFCVLYEF